jgi:hypothetical protein
MLTTPSISIAMYDKTDSLVAAYHGAAIPSRGEEVTIHSVTTIGTESNTWLVEKVTHEVFFNDYRVRLGVTSLNYPKRKKETPDVHA